MLLFKTYYGSFEPPSRNILVHHCAFISSHYISLQLHKNDSLIFDMHANLCA